MLQYIFFKDADHVKALKRIHFCHVNDVYQLMEMLWAPEMREYKLVIIDSLATLFLPIRGDSFNDGMQQKCLDQFEFLQTS